MAVLGAQGRFAVVLALACCGHTSGWAQEPAPAPTPEGGPKLTWGDGKTTLETGGFALNLSNRMQLRWLEELPDGANRLAGTVANGDAKGSFRFARVRTKFDGWAFKKGFQYEVQLDWADATSIVQDLNLNWDVSGDRRFQIRFGQFKIPFGRQAITSAMYQEFVDRSIVAVEFEKIRDQGVQVWGQLGGSRLEYRAGIFNGGGRQRTLGTPGPGNDNGKYQYDVRLMYQPFGGDVRYSEADFDSKDQPLFAVAANVEENDARLPLPADGAPVTAPSYRRLVLGADVSFKYRGFALMGEYFDRSLTPISGPSFQSNGYHAQAGYFVKRQKVELAFRFASWDPNATIAADERRELGAVVTYFYSKHNLKVQADLRRLEDEAKKTRDSELRLQTQLVF